MNWIDATLESGFSGTARYAQIGSVVFYEFNLTHAQSSYEPGIFATGFPDPYTDNTAIAGEGSDSTIPTQTGNLHFYISDSGMGAYESNFSHTGSTWDTLSGVGVYLTDTGNGQVSIPLENFQYSIGKDCVNTSVVPKVATSITQTLPPGLYRVSAVYRWSNNSTATDFIGRVYQDGNPLGTGPHRQEPQDVGGGTGKGNTDQRHTATLLHYVQITEETQTTFQLKFNPSVQGIISAIFNPTIELWKVA